MQRIRARFVAVVAVGIAGLALNGASSPGQQTVTVRITNDALEVQPTTVRAGRTTFNVTNNASVPYDFDVDGPGLDGELDDLPPGKTQSLTLVLQAGTYALEIDSEQRPEREQRVMLTVRR
jgi:hypothetical protein